MRYDFNDSDSNLGLSDSTDNYKTWCGRKELYLLLLTFAIGITVDYWFNNHQLPPIASRDGASISTPALVKSKNTALKNVINLLL
ncbi:hypothetical protein NIES4071_59570 [Calothrix sp. NIES-4071]|nr:hypothetical protein NIES4071_59570 [Calothrix sp. NIES-4071]BAZ60264.1 hypothetical protein NIES4105_59520 [Calothrix sp. NIES-4105]